MDSSVLLDFMVLSEVLYISVRNIKYKNGLARPSFRKHFIKNRKMNSQAIHLFIVDSNGLMVNKLKQYLYKKFSTNLNISIFYTIESCLEKMDERTNFVVIDYYSKREGRDEIVQSIKTINPKTEIIIHCSNEDIGSIVEPLYQQTNNIVTKNSSSVKKIIPLISKMIPASIRRIGKEYFMSKYLVIFFSIFILMGIVVFFVIKIMPR